VIPRHDSPLPLSFLFRLYVPLHRNSRLLAALPCLGKAFLQTPRVNTQAPRKRPPKLKILVQLTPPPKSRPSVSKVTQGASFPDAENAGTPIRARPHAMFHRKQRAFLWPTLFRLIPHQTPPKATPLGGGSLSYPWRRSSRRSFGNNRLRPPGPSASPSGASNQFFGGKHSATLQHQIHQMVLMLPSRKPPFPRQHPPFCMERVVFVGPRAASAEPLAAKFTPLA